MVKVMVWHSLLRGTKVTSGLASSVVVSHQLILWTFICPLVVLALMVSWLHEDCGLCPVIVCTAAAAGVAFCNALAGIHSCPQYRIPAGCH